MNYNIKKFNELKVNEIYNILKLRTEIFIIEQECIYQDCDGKDEKSHHLLVKEDENIIAYLRIIEKGVSYDKISIGRVCVNKDYRQRGICRQMMLEAIKFIENELKENEIKIQAQSYLKEFYGSLGFKDISEEYLEDNIPHIDMIYKK